MNILKNYNYDNSIDYNIYTANWRDLIGKKEGYYNWRFCLRTEYMIFLDKMVDLAKKYDWNLWGSGVKKYAVNLHQAKTDGLYISIAIKSNENYSYFVSFKRELNPNNMDNSDYYKCLGNMDQALEFVEMFLKDNNYEKEDFTNIIELGNAYDRFPLEKKWEYDRLRMDAIIV